MRRTWITLLVGAALAVTALAVIASKTQGPVRWTPDGLFYQARALELRGEDRPASLERTFQGPMGAELRIIDPEKSGDPAWVAYHAKFYERRIAVPAAANAIEPMAGERAILTVSMIGLVASVAAAVSLAAIFLPALTRHSAFPLTDSWGLALETAALASGILVLRRGARWLVPWTAALLLLSFTRDSTWIPLLAAAWMAVTLRTRLSWALLGSAVAAVLPVLLLFPLPTRDLFATMLNGAQPVASGARWGSSCGGARRAAPAATATG